MQTQAEIQEIVRQRDQAERDLNEVVRERDEARSIAERVVADRRQAASDAIYVTMLAAVFRDDEWKQGAHPEADIAHRIDAAKKMTVAAIYARPTWMKP